MLFNLHKIKQYNISKNHCFGAKLLIVKKIIKLTIIINVVNNQTSCFLSECAEKRKRTVLFVFRYL